MNCAILLSGGTGTRMGQDVPKQYLELRSRPVITYSLRTLGDHPEVGGIVVVAHEDWRQFIQKQMEEDGNYAIGKFIAFADPGETRQLSVWNALEKVRECAIGADAVIVHDAARPFVTQQLLSRCIGALSGHDGVMPVLRAKDTFYLTDNGRVSQLLDRNALVAGQAPEVFDYVKYYEAHLKLSKEELLRLNGSTEVAVLAGLDVVTVEGDERNIKITTPNDLTLAERYLEEEA